MNFLDAAHNEMVRERQVCSSHRWIYSLIFNLFGGGDRGDLLACSD